jgi:hypothetical protein
LQRVGTAATYTRLSIVTPIFYDPPETLRGSWTPVEPLQKAAVAFALFLMELLKAG